MMGCCNFTCENYKFEGQKVILNTIAAVFFSNKWKRSTASVRKDDVASFKKQKKKENLFFNFDL